MIDPLAEPNSIAFAGDWHGNDRWGVRAIRKAAGSHADVILHLGDFGYYFTDRYLDALQEVLSENKIPLLFVDGNHENFSYLESFPIEANGLRKLRPNVWHIPRGFRWTWQGVRFIGVGGAHSVDKQYRTPGVSWWPEETLTEADAARATEGGTVDIMISHDCPAGVTIPGLSSTSGLFPTEEIHAANAHRGFFKDAIVDIIQPKILWAGHYHRYYKLYTDIGYGPVRVIGLDCDGSSINENVKVELLKDLKEEVSKLRSMAV